MISVCEHEKKMKMWKPSKSHPNIIKFQLTGSAYLVNLGSLLEPKLNPWERCKRSRELSWGALGGIGRRLGRQNGTKRASRVLTVAKWRPFKMYGKTNKNKHLSSWAGSWKLLGWPRRHQRRPLDTLWAYFGDVKEAQIEPEKLSESCLNLGLSFDVDLGAKNDWMMVTWRNAQGPLNFFCIF